jgi:AP-1 complex subunit gamma-1
LDDLLGGGGGGGGGPPAAAPAAAAAAAAPVTVTAFDKDGLRLTLAFSKPDPSNPSVTAAVATATNSGLDDVEGFSLQAAVPKYMQLRLEPASGATVQGLGGAPVTQRLTVTNAQHGAKPVALRLRIAYTVGGRSAVEQAEVSGLPAGF